MHAGSENLRGFHKWPNPWRLHPSWWQHSVDLIFQSHEQRICIFAPSQCRFDRVVIVCWRRRTFQTTNLLFQSGRQCFHTFVTLLHLPDWSKRDKFGWFVQNRLQELFIIVTFSNWILRYRSCCFLSRIHNRNGLSLLLVLGNNTRAFIDVSKFFSQLLQPRWQFLLFCVSRSKTSSIVP